MKRKSFATVLIFILCFGTFAFMAVNMASAFPGDKPALVVEPSDIQNASLTIGSTFQVNVSIYNVTLGNVPTGLESLEVHLEWNTTVLVPTSFVSYIGTRVLNGSLVYVIPVGFYDSGNNIISTPPFTSATSFAFAVASNSGWFGSNVTATITFKVLAVGNSTLDMPYIAMTDLNSIDIPFYQQNGFFSNIAFTPPPPLSASISPMSTSIMLGQNVNFTSTVSGGVPPYTYQWYMNGTIVPGANSSSWDFTPLATGSYDVYLNVTDNVGNTVASTNASVTVTPPASLVASITSSSTAVYVGQTANLSSTVVGGVPPYTFQWLLNGSFIPSATLTNYTFSPNASGLFLFSMNVTDSYATMSQSNTVSITVMPPLTGPVIYVDPPEILNLSLGPGSLFSINITVANVTNLGGCMFNLTYDPHVLTWIGLNFVETQGQYPTAVLNGSSIAGYAWISLYYSYPITVQSAPLTVLNFYVNSYGITLLNLTNTVLLDQYGNPIVHNAFGGIFANIIRDVAVTNVVPAANWIYQNWTDTINVTLANLGNVTESFTASAWYDSSLIGSAPVVNLAPNAQTIVSIVWNTTGVAAGNYTITGTASLVPYEIYFNTTNNVFVDGTVQVLTTIHDVAITSVLATIPWVYAGQIVPVNVTAANLGDVSESFNVTAYYNGTTIGTLPVTNLQNGTSQVLTIYWNTSGISVEGNYTLSAFASYVPFEYNTANNYFTGGQVLVLTLIRDVAIINVQPYPQMISPIYHVPMVEVYANRVVTVNVTAANLGNVTETFDVTALIDGSITLGTQTVSNLPPQNITVLTFYWYPTGQTPSSTVLHTVSANCSFVQYEYNTTNNIMTSSVKVMIKLLGDINGDGKVSLSDLNLFSKAYNTQIGNPNYNPEADLNNDGYVNLADFATFSRNYNISY